MRAFCPDLMQHGVSETAPAYIHNCQLFMYVLPPTPPPPPLPEQGIRTGSGSCYEAHGASHNNCARKSELGLGAAMRLTELPTTIAPETPLGILLVHLLSIHSYGNTLKYMSYSLSIPASNLKKNPRLLISIRYRPELNIDI